MVILLLGIPLLDRLSIILGAATGPLHEAKDYGEALKRMHELIGKKLKKQFLPLNLKSSINV